MPKGKSARSKKKGVTLKNLPKKRLAAAQEKSVKGGTYAIGRIEPRFPKLTPE
jgi:hypothetical protein